MSFGGETEAEDGISVTKVEDFVDTVETYRKVFEKHELYDVWEILSQWWYNPVWSMEIHKCFIITVQRQKDCVLA